jgi:hypothetical protein
MMIGKRVLRHVTERTKRPSGTHHFFVFLETRLLSRRREEMGRKDGERNMDDVGRVLRHRRVNPPPPWTSPNIPGPIPKKRPLIKF